MQSLVKGSNGGVAFLPRSPLLPIPVTSGLLAQHQQWSGCVVPVRANVYGKTLP